MLAAQPSLSAPPVRRSSVGSLRGTAGGVPDSSQRMQLKALPSPGRLSPLSVAPVRPPPPVVAFATHIPPRAPSPRSRPKLSPRKVPSPRLAPITLSPPKGWIHHDNTWVKGQEFFIRCFPPEVEVVKPRTPVIVELPKDPLVLRKEELTKAFNEIDDDGNGYLEPHELKEVFVRAGYKVTDEQIETAMKALDANDDGVIDLEEFQKLSEMITEEAIQSAGKPKRARVRAKSTGFLDGLFGGAMGEFLLEGMMATVMNPDYVGIDDGPKKKTVSGGELSKMLDDSVPKYDPDDGPQLTAHDLKEKLRKNFEQVISTFRKFDTDNSGTIDLSEWTTALCRLFRKANQADVEALFHDFDEDGGGTIDYEEFAYTLKMAEPKKKQKKLKRRSE